MKPSQALDAHRTELRDLVARFGVLRPRVFGSVATGSDAEDSDLDLLVDPTPGTMRHKLVHDYFDVDLSIVWDTVRHDLPKLAIQVRHVLEEITTGRSEWP